MANKRLGSNTSWNGQRAVKVESNTYDVKIKPSDCGTVFFCKSGADGITWLHLPLLSSIQAGWNCKFVMLEDGASNGIRIMAGGQSSSAGGAEGDANTMRHFEIICIADTADGGAGGGASDGLTFTTAAKAGDYIEMFTDGEEWYGPRFLNAEGGANLINA